MEWKSSVWGEGHIWDIRTWAFVDSKGHQLESPYWLSSWVTFLLRVQPGVDPRRWEGKRAQSLLPLPGSPSCACDSHGNAKGTKISQFFLCCSKTPVLSRVIFDLCMFFSFLSVRHIFLEFWQVFFLYFEVGFYMFSLWFFLVYMCNQLCASFLSRPNRCTLAEWLLLPFLIPNLEPFKIYLFASLTFPLPWQWK